MRGKLSDMDADWDQSPSPQCRVCEDASLSGSYLCDRCRRLLNRLETRKHEDGRGRRFDRRARFLAMTRQWDPAARAFRCHYTGIPMTESYGSRTHATWEHVTPGDESSVVLVADLVNKMKSDMTEDEFRGMVRALARRFDGEPFDERAFPRRGDGASSVVVGVDGTSKGWVVVTLKDGAFADAALKGSFQDVLDGYPDAMLVAVDIPIGLPEGAEPREADVAAKRFLGRGSSSVFPTPSRAVLEAASHAEASALAVERTGKGISQQSFALRRKILEVDPLVTDRVIEVHPEVSFRAMSDGVVLPSKKTWSGIMMRRRLLAEAGIEVPDDLGDAGLLPADDVLDAAAAAWSALRYTRGDARSLPENPPTERRSRAVAIWY